MKKTNSMKKWHGLIAGIALVAGLLGMSISAETDAEGQIIEKPEAARLADGRVRDLTDIQNAVDVSQGVNINPSGPTQNPQAGGSKVFPSFSAINAPVWVSDTGPLQAAQDLILHGLTEVRVGLTNNTTPIYALPFPAAQGAPSCDPNAAGTNKFTGCIWDGRNINRTQDAPLGPLSSAFESAPIPNPAPDSLTPIDFDFGSGGANSEAAGSDEFTIWWAANVRFRAGTYRFSYGADDGVKVELRDGATQALLAERTDLWSDAAFRESSFDQTFASDKDITIRLGFYENRGDAQVLFGWQRLPDSGPTIPPPPAPIYSDLVVNSITLTPAAPSANTAVTIRALIRNQGATAANSQTIATMTVDPLQNRQVIRTATTNALLVNGSQQVSFTWTATTGAHTIQVCADSGQTLTETSELNNCRQFFLNVFAVSPALGFSPTGGASLLHTFIPKAHAQGQGGYTLPAPPPANSGRLLGTPIAIWSDLYVGGTGQGTQEKGDIILEGSLVAGGSGMLQMASPVTFAEDVQFAKNASVITDLTVGGKIKLGGVDVAAENGALKVNGPLTASSIGRFYQKESPLITVNSANWQGTAAACDQGHVMISCNSWFGGNLPASAAWFQNFIKLSDVDTCTTKGKRNSASDNFTLKAVAVCFSPGG